MQYISHYDSPLGNILLAADGGNLTGLWFEGQKHFARTLGDIYEEQNLPVLEAAKHWLDVYFSGREPDFRPPLRWNGTPFQQDVWEILLTIPYGKTVTYGDIAKMLAARPGHGPVSAQAVGGAVGRNPLSVMVPCHRVVGAGGRITGYAGGIDNKIALLALEGAAASSCCLSAERP